MRSFLRTLLLASIIVFPFIGLLGLKSTPDRIFSSYIQPVKNAVYKILDIGDVVSSEAARRYLQGPSKPSSAATPSAVRSPSSWSAAKDETYGLHKESPITLYCGCLYTENRSVRPNTCGYKDITNSRRSRRTEVEHIVPASWIGKGRACWAQGGRSYCDKSDPGYKTAAYDLHNLSPAIGRVNQVRLARPFRMLPGESRAFGACDFEAEDYGVEPSPYARGVVARATLYMNSVHGVSMGQRYLDMMKVWSLDNPPTRFECLKNLRVGRIQGFTNEFVDSACERGLSSVARK